MIDALAPYAAPGAWEVLRGLGEYRGIQGRTLAWQGHGWQQGGKEPNVLCTG